MLKNTAMGQWKITFSFFRVVSSLWVLLLLLTTLYTMGTNCELVILKSKELIAKIGHKELMFASFYRIISTDYHIKVPVKIPAYSAKALNKSENADEVYGSIVKSYMEQVAKMRKENPELFNMYRNKVLSMSAKDIEQCIGSISPESQRLYNASKVGGEFKQVIDQIKKTDPELYDKISGI